MVNARVFIGDARKMYDVADESIHLVVTSPPYWDIKDYGSESQIGYGQTLHTYLRDLYQVWQECFRALKSGRRLCINIGDQFARSQVYGRYKVIPLHAECIAQCEQIGFDFLGSIIWQKKTTMNTTGGAAIMGSYPYPPNGMVEIDYEYILLFKKPGKPDKYDPEIKAKSILTKDEWKQYFCGHWSFGGARQEQHQAVFPEELPRRLIKMFSFEEEAVLDPFLGSGTTLQVAVDLHRNGVGYEINPDFIPLIENRISSLCDAFRQPEILIETALQPIFEAMSSPYTPSISDAEPLSENRFEPKEKTDRVKEVSLDGALVLDSGVKVLFDGVRFVDEKLPDALAYLAEYLKNKEVIVRDPVFISDKMIFGWVLMKNKIQVNKFLINSGYAIPIQRRTGV